MIINWWIHQQKPLAHESHDLPHGKILLTPHDDSSLNLVLPFSNDVRLETAGNQFDGGPFEFV